MATAILCGLFIGVPLLVFMGNMLKQTMKMFEQNKNPATALALIIVAVAFFGSIILAYGALIERILW